MAMTTFPGPIAEPAGLPISSPSFSMCFCLLHDAGNGALGGSSSMNLTLRKEYNHHLTNTAHLGSGGVVANWPHGWSRANRPGPIVRKTRTKMDRNGPPGVWANLPPFARLLGAFVRFFSY